VDKARERLQNSISNWWSTFRSPSWTYPTTRKMSVVPPVSTFEHAEVVDSSSTAWIRVAAVLPLRLVGFVVAQSAIALALVVGNSDPWAASARWWPFAAILTNGLTFLVVNALLRREGRRWRDILVVDTPQLRRDLPVVLGLAMAAAVLAIVPNFALATLLFGDAELPVATLFQPLPLWAAVATLLLFPLTIALTELPTYFGYLQPRLEALLGRPWLAISLAGGFLAVQHATLPLVFDSQFILWRALTYLPLAVMLAVTLRWRPRLMPYMIVLHAIADFQAALMVVTA
jgi:hypothetical protein